MLDACAFIGRDIAKDDTTYLTQDTATMRQHYTISVTTQRHIFEFPFKRRDVARREKKRR